jgi:hypothetical protein
MMLMMMTFGTKLLKMAEQLIKTQEHLASTRDMLRVRFQARQMAELEVEREESYLEEAKDSDI